jgi:FlaA1/EpsC-like NDP-sugar epimerase
MIRIFNHYVHRSALRGILFDLALVLVVAVLAVCMQISSVGQAVPLAGTHVVSFAACVFVINSASGLYEAGPSISPGRSAARALLVLMVALPLTYVIFGMLPAAFANREAVQLSTMAGASALILRRAYLSHSSAAAAGRRTRILIFGAGSAAQLVGNTLKSSDPNAHIVGYVPGPNEREPAVLPHEILSMVGTLPDLAHRLEVDEIVVALTERRAGSMPLRQLLDCKVSGIKVYDLNTWARSASTSSMQAG